MSLGIRKIFVGGPGRPTRFHTETGKLIPLAEFRFLPTVVYQYVRTRVSGHRPEEPWWPCPVIPIIASHLNEKSQVIEFGSGGSTVWLAKRCASVLSVEDDLEWSARTKARLETAGLTNATVKFAQGADYYNVSELSDRRFDLAIIDGSHRYRCVESVLPLMKTGSIVYLDNSDADKDRSVYPDPSMSREAQRILEQYCEQTPRAKLTRIASLISGELHAGEGMVLHL